MEIMLDNFIINPPMKCNMTLQELKEHVNKIKFIKYKSDARVCFV